MFTAMSGRLLGSSRSSLDEKGRLLSPPASPVYRLANTFNFILTLSRITGLITALFNRFGVPGEQQEELRKWRAKHEMGEELR